MVYVIGNSAGAAVLVGTELVYALRMTARTREILPNEVLRLSAVPTSIELAQYESERSASGGRA
jgi:hypothetical protein